VRSPFLLNVLAQCGQLNSFLQCDCTCSHTVPVKLGSKYTADDWTQKLMTIQDFVDNFLSSSSKTTPTQIGYVAEHILFDQVSQ
jgi:hypothetical protein